MKKLKKMLFWSVLMMTAFLGIVYCIVSLNAYGRTYDNITDIPARKVGILLATSPITPQGKRNSSFSNRIKATLELYKAGKIKIIVASGGDYEINNDSIFTKYGCDEPWAIRDSLVAHGVPSDKIILDYNGTRTLYSIVKAKQVYNLDSVILISQKYHNERAIFQADHYKLNAIGYNAAPAISRYSYVRNAIREIFARVKLLIDIWFSNTPRFNAIVPETSSGEMEDWLNYRDQLRGKSVRIYYSRAKQGEGLYKTFGVMDDKPYYYNDMHNYFLWLPKGIGYIQRGENLIGAHGDEFYNSDSTLVVNVFGRNFSDIIHEIPNYADTLRVQQLENLHHLGQVQFLKNTTDTIIAEVKIDHTKGANHLTDIMLSKYILSHGAYYHEIELSLSIYFADSLSYRKAEFFKILNSFPNFPKEGDE